VKPLFRSVVCFLRREEGQDLVEYGLLASLISIASIAALGTLGLSLAGLWGRIVGDLGGYFS
jgi:Flp pilus assembly pilin Flp